MADPEQLELLKRDGQEWNQWRQQQPNLYPDLVQADLSRANLRGVDLSRANLRGANLRGADLSRANLRDVKGANLQEALLFDANLVDSDLTGADFSKAILMDTDLRRADLTEVHFFCTTLAWMDLSYVKGLDTAIHDGPSSVDINSVVLPYDKPTRVHFLRGVGFTETQIEYLPSLLTPRPIEYSSLFISYAHQDEAIAKRLHTDFRKKDVPCWFAPHDLRPGTPILREIGQAIHRQDKFLLILSSHAVNSRWIEREVDAALHQEIQRGKDVLFPIRLDNTILESNAGWATHLQHRHIADFTNWQDDDAYQQAFAMLLRHLKVTKPPTPLS